jgi:hypothetical protein
VKHLRQQDFKRAANIFRCIVPNTSGAASATLCRKILTLFNGWRNLQPERVDLDGRHRNDVGVKLQAVGISNQISAHENPHQRVVVPHPVIIQAALRIQQAAREKRCPVVVRWAIVGGEIGVEERTHAVGPCNCISAERRRRYRRRQPCSSWHPAIRRAAR